jgi:hypothetical protein
VNTRLEVAPWRNAPAIARGKGRLVPAAPPDGRQS